MPASIRAAAVLVYAQSAFLVLVAVGMVDIVLEPPAGGTKAIAVTLLVLAYAALLGIAAFRLARSRRHARGIALGMQLLPMTAALYLASQGIWSGWIGAAYCLLLGVLLKPVDLRRYREPVHRRGTRPHGDRFPPDGKQRRPPL